MAKHILTFEGAVPDTERERARIYADPAVQSATEALHEALKAAGHPHTVSSKIVKTRAPGAAKRKRPAVVAAAE